MFQDFSDDLGLSSLNTTHRITLVRQEMTAVKFQFNYPIAGHLS
jgi:hypothetical protein